MREREKERKLQIKRGILKRIAQRQSSVVLLPHIRCLTCDTFVIKQARYIYFIIYIIIIQLIKDKEQHIFFLFLAPRFPKYFKNNCKIHFGSECWVICQWMQTKQVFVPGLAFPSWDPAKNAKKIVTNIQKILSKQSYCNYSLSITVKNKSMQEYTTVLS